MQTRWISMVFAAAAGASARAAEFAPAQRIAKLEAKAVNEGSGLAVSSSDPGSLWTLNDSGGRPEIYLVGADGSDRGVLRVRGGRNVDWEDIATYTLAGKNYILIADTGDNDSNRKTCMIHIMREPPPPPAGKRLNSVASPVWTLTFRYEDGPRDCEAVGVDAVAGKILLLSKRTHPPELYELPLGKLETDGILTAHKIGAAQVKAPGGAPIPFRNQPTGLDIAADGSFAAVVTYYGMFVFSRKPDESWPDAFARRPADLGPHRLAQAESAAISKDGKAIYSISEGAGTPIVIYRAKPAAKEVPKS
jgi:hypothetical protein